MRSVRIFVVSVILYSGLSAATASTGGLELNPVDRALLTDYARDTWRSIAAAADRGPLPADALRRCTDGAWIEEGLTSPSNIAAYLWSTVAAEDLHLISTEEATQRVGRTLTTLAALERSHGFFFNWYDPATGQPARVWPGGGTVRPFLSVVDNGWLAAALMLIGNTRPEFRPATDALLAPMNFGFFYDPFDPTSPAIHPGLLRGGYWPDNDTFAGFHYGALNTEPRIASYIGIARGDLPPEHYYRMFRSSPEPVPGVKVAASKYNGVAVTEGTLSYRALQIVPSWDGTMFEALMVSMLVPEAEWAPLSWGTNHPLYVRAQIEYGLHDANLGYWGLSAASAPQGGYGVFGVAALGVRTHNEKPLPLTLRPGVVAPYASFLALPFAPTEAVANLRALTHHFAIYGPYGFRDSVDVHSGKVSDRVLVLDQGMILGSLANVIGSDPLRRGFCTGPVECKIKPLIAQERFDARVDTSWNPLRPEGRPVSAPEPSTVESRPLASADHTYSLPRPLIHSPHLVGGILTFAGAFAVLATRSRAAKALRPTSAGVRLH